MEFVMQILFLKSTKTMQRILLLDLQGLREDQLELWLISQRVSRVLEWVIEGATPAEKRKLFHDNAIRDYRLA